MATSHQLNLCWQRYVTPYGITWSQWVSTFIIHEQINHYGDAIMGMIASQITILTIVYSSVYSDADQRKHQSSASLAFVRRIHRWPVNSPHKWPVTWKMFPFDDWNVGVNGNTLNLMIMPEQKCVMNFWYFHMTKLWITGSTQTKDKFIHDKYWILSAVARKAMQKYISIKYTVFLDLIIQL